MHYCLFVIFGYPRKNYLRLKTVIKIILLCIATRSESAYFAASTFINLYIHLAFTNIVEYHFASPSYLFDRYYFFIFWFDSLQISRKCQRDLDMRRILLALITVSASQNFRGPSCNFST
jgi:hypothetical protein